MLLDGRPAGERVTLTEIRTRTPRHTSSPRVAEVLAGLDLLKDDSTPAIRSWIERRAGELPQGFAASGPGLAAGAARRRRPGPAPLARQHLRLLQRRPAAHRALVSRPRPPPRGHRADIKAVLDPLRGHQLRTTIAAVRSLFRFAKKTRTDLRQPRRAAEGRRSRRQPAADDRRRDPGRRTGRHQPRTAADRRPGRGPRRPLGPRSATSPWTTLTCPTGASPSPGTASGSANSPARRCGPGSAIAAPPGRAPPTGTS